MKKLLLIPIIALGLLGCSQNTPTPNKTQNTTLLGTYTWDVESNKQGDSHSRVDFWYQRKDANSGALVSKNGTTIEVVDLEYSAITKNDITSRPMLRDGRISSSNLKVGTVAIFKTSEGNFGKLRIVGFKALHDFDFKEARENTSQSTKKYLLSKPNNRKYHLVVEYQLFR